MIPDLKQVPLTQQIKAALSQAVSYTFQHAFNIKLNIEPCIVARQPLDLDPDTTSFILMRDLKRNPLGIFLVHIEKPLLEKVLAPYHPVLSHTGSALNDLAEEITNMIFGIFKPTLRSLGFTGVMDLPHMLHDQSWLVSPYHQEEKVVLTFHCEGFQGQAVLMNYPPTEPKL